MQPARRLHAARARGRGAGGRREPGNLRAKQNKPTMPSDNANPLDIRTALRAAFAPKATDSEALRSGDSISLRPWLEELLAAAPGSVVEIPSLNTARAEQLKDGQLVRFVGMVQDVHDPEYYEGVYEEALPDGTTRLCTAKYVVPPAPGVEWRSRPEFLWQRTPIVCVPPPAQTAWVSEGVAGPSKETAGAGVAAAPRAKRGAEEAEMDVEAAVSAAAETAAPASGIMDDAASKRVRAPVCVRCGPEDGPAPVASGAAGGVDAWRRAPAGGVALQVYDDADSFKVHDLVEVYGVLEHDLGSWAAQDPRELGAMQLSVAEEKNLRPPPSAQPRLHVITHRKLDDVHSPLLPAAGSADEAAAIATARSGLPGLRGSLVRSLASTLGGDELAAELVLLSVLSRIVGRHGEAPVGKLHLNLTGCPPPQPGARSSPVASALAAALSELLPTLATQPISPAHLNDSLLTPTKDAEANCIWPALLQLPHGATLLLDEAMMAEGKLHDRGVRNVRALATALEVQKVGYDFTYFQVDMPIDATLLSVSSSPSMLPFGAALPLQLSPTAPPPPPEANSAEWLGAARTYLGLAVRAQKALASISPELTAALQDDFVECRKRDPKVGADDFGRWLTYARLVAASELEPSVEMCHYERAKQLEGARAQRLRARQVEV